MPIVAVPNVSEGRDHQLIDRLGEVLRGGGARVLDIHADAAHHRSVFTVTGSGEDLGRAVLALAGACKEQLDLREHSGMHPRLGALDVCPFVPHDMPIDEAVHLAHRVGEAIADNLDLPIYFYGAAAKRPETRELPDLRRGGLDVLTERALGDLRPDEGPRSIDPRYGVVCVGARDVLVAFNVWIDAPAERADEIASRVRAQGGGLPGLRALGIAVDDSRSQVSMNLTDPDQAGIDHAFEAVATAANELAIPITATEIIGLVPEKFLPKANAKAARLLIEPGRSLESALAT
ncbi:MAG: glutamate formimidoyltransferase [Actinomycetota bacterium]